MLQALKRVVRLFLPNLSLRFSIARAVPEPELRGICALAGDGVFVDVGANIGVWSYHAAKHFKSVQAFEPDAELSRRLRIVLPANVEVHGVALSDHNGTAELQTPVIDGRKIPSRASLQSEVNGPVAHHDQPVRLVTLDSLCLDEVDAIKIDVEGHESAVLAGASDTILRNRPVLVVEIEERHHPGASDDIIRFLVEKNFVCYYVEGNRLRRYQSGSIAELQADLPQKIGERKIDYINNFVFMPTERAALIIETFENALSGTQ